jgi:hypothetical protein
MTKKLTEFEFSPNLIIPGFDVKVENEHSCHVVSKDGRHRFSAKIEVPYIKISGPMFAKPLVARVGPWEWVCRYATDADDVITQVANSLRWMDQLLNEGFSAKIDRHELILSHPSKPDYSLRMCLIDARRLVSSPYTSVYTEIGYCGPEYDVVWSTQRNRLERRDISNLRLIVIDKNFEELAQELKTRVLSLGEPDPRIAQWVTQEIKSELLPQGFTFTPRLDKGIVEWSHPSGLSGSLSFALFTAGYDYYIYYTNPKYPNPHFPTDIEKDKVVLLTCGCPNIQETYTKAWSANEPQDTINDIRSVLACTLVYQEVCSKWKSDILIPKWNGNSLHLVNTKREGEESIILELTREKNKLSLKGMGDKLSYPISGSLRVVDTKKITRTIVERADRHVQKFIRDHKITSKVIEVEW